jgi:hypothetical protein
VDVVAASLGTPLIPWQRYVADVANERHPDGSYRYPVVLVSVPRQTGKTTLIRANGVHTCLVCGRDVFYTAQTGKDARARWMDLVKVLRLNPAYASRVKVALRAGAENVAFPNGAAFHAFAPTAESLHGYTPHKVKLDEAFKHTKQAGELLMGAIEPAQFTIVDRQLWIVSTAGTAESDFLHDWLDLGMTGAPGVACFVWAARQDQDPYSLTDIPLFHPGVGFQLGDKVIGAHDVLTAADKTTRAEYLRAYANRRARIKVAYHAPGTSWLAPKVLELWQQLRPRKVRAAGNGPVIETTQQLAGRVPVDVLTEHEFATATGRFLSMVDDRLLDHDGTRELAEGVSGLVTRAAITDGIAFSRRNSMGDTSLGVAAAVGVWSAVTAPLDPGTLYTLGDPE